MARTIELPIIDLASPDRISTANSIHQACVDYGFFYLINHGVEESLLRRVFEGNKAFHALPVEEKMKAVHKESGGYTPMSPGGSKEMFCVGPLEDRPSPTLLNQWPSERVLPGWRSTMEYYYKQVLVVGKRLSLLIALSLNLEESFFSDLGAFNQPNAFLCLLHYPGGLGSPTEEVYGASAHSDFGMLTLLATDGIGGLQVCRDKFKNPWLWEEVQHIPGAFIVNVGDMMERWTNYLFRSTLHQVMLRGKERYSVAFFLEPNQDCVVECIKSCCSESNPPRFPPIRSGEYTQRRLKGEYDF